MFSLLNQQFSKLKFTHSTTIRPLSGFVLASIVWAALTIYFQGSPLVRDWEQRFQSHFHLFGSYFDIPEAGPSPIVVILINDQSIPEGTPRSPLNRKWLGSLIDRISNRQPALIGLNVLLDRSLAPPDDNVLAEAVEKSGRVIIRSDPLYPPIQKFAEAALDHGTMRFRIDSSGAVQEICQSSASCRSDHIFHTRLLQHIKKEDSHNTDISDQMDWLRIDFSAAYRSSAEKRYIRFPVLYASEVEQLPNGALKDKIVLIGTGFPDLYPLYRTPLPADEQFLQETEVLAMAVDMVLSDRYVRSLSPVPSAFLIITILLILSLLLTRRGILSGFRFTVVALPVLFFVAATTFTFYNLEVPFVLPAMMITFFLAAGTVQQVLQERFARLMAELKLKEAKIDFLTNELHTHHLFNELSRLNVMIGQHPKKARAYLVEFAELLRASLKYSDQPRVPVPVQIDYINTYLQQQGIIHGEQFRFNLDVKEDWETVHAPWHTFYPLVENAVKAAEGVLREQPDQPVTIEIVLRKENNQLTFTVENPFLPGRESQSTRKGLANLEERLISSYPRQGFELSAIQKGSRWIATLKLPLS